MLPNKNFEELLRLLAEREIEFLVVGGVAAVLHGAPVVTQDLDIVHHRTPQNIGKLLTLLQELRAYGRADLAGRKLAPTQEQLSGHGHLNLQTVHGPIDILCELGEGEGYEELIEHTIAMTDGGISIRILDLPTLIRVKTAAGRLKDRLVVPILIATLDELRHRGRPD